MMQIAMQARGLKLSPTLRAHVARRLGYALGCFRHRIANVQVTLSDVNGPRGGRDECCELLVEQPRRRRLFVRQLAEDAFAAVALACSRAAVSADRRLKRRTRRVRSTGAVVGTGI